MSGGVGGRVTNRRFRGVALSCWYATPCRGRMLLGSAAHSEPPVVPPPFVERNIPMPKSHYVDFKSVKTSVTMEQVLQHYGLLEQMKRSGDSLSGCCPIHGGTNSTQFRVSISKNCWNCFSECKSGGNVLDFVAKKERITVHAAATKLCEWFQLPMEDHRSAAPNKLPKPQPPPKPTSSSPVPTVVEEKPKPEDETSNPALRFRLEHLDATHPYLAERGLSPETLMDFGQCQCIGFDAQPSLGRDPTLGGGHPSHSGAHPRRPSPEDRSDRPRHCGQPRLLFVESPGILRLNSHPDHHNGRGFLWKTDRESNTHQPTRLQRGHCRPGEGECPNGRASEPQAH